MTTIFAECGARAPGRSRWMRARERLHRLADLVAPRPGTSVMPHIGDYPLARPASRNRLVGGAGATASEADNRLRRR